MKFAREETREIGRREEPLYEGIKGATSGGVALFIFYFGVRVTSVEVAALLAVVAAFGISYADGRILARRRNEAYREAFAEYLRRNPE